MAGREPPHMGPMAHGFAALGEAAERAVSTISALAADAAQAPSRLGNIARLLTADGKLGTVWQVTLLPCAGWRRMLEESGLIGVDIGAPVDTFGGAGGESKARLFEVSGYAFVAHKPK
jgi:hypothetical protein